MRKTILLSLFALALALPAWAIPVPAGKAAVVEAVIGKVTADEGKGFKNIKLGQNLAPGASVKTGPNGRVSLRLPDGSVGRIAANTEFLLKAETARKGIFTRLLKGTVRFLVAKQAPGHSFETEMVNSVAAVKGTDPEYETDGKVAKAKVFSSGNPVALLFTDSKSGKETSLKAGDKLVFDGDSFKMEKIDKEDIEKSEKNYDGLPDAKTEEGGEGEGGEPGAGSGSGSGSGSGDSGDKSGDDSLDAATEEALEDAMADLYLDGFLERDERTGDIAAGKIVYDRFGERVQVTHFITREDDMSVSIASFSAREAGPNQGVTTAIEAATFNQALPENWGEVFRRNLDDAANLDGNGYPIYFRTTQQFLAANPTGDSVLVDTAFYDPSWVASQGGPLEQGFLSNLSVNGQLQLSIEFYDPSAAGNGNVSAGGIYGYGDSFQNTAESFEGGWRFHFNDYSNDVLVQDLHFLDDAGNLLEHPSFTGTPAFPSAFNGYDANVEVAFHSSLFEGRSIDLIFLPGFFDIYDMWNTAPFESYNNN